MVILSKPPLNMATQESLFNEVGGSNHYPTPV